MKFLKNITKKGDNFAAKLMLSYSILLLIILLIGINLYDISKNNLQESVKAQTKSQLEDAAGKFDSDLASMQNLALYFTRDRLIKKFARTSIYDENEFHLNAYNAQISCRVYTPIQRLLPINSYYIHFNNSDYILSPTAFSHMKNYYHSNSMLENHYGQWQDTLKNGEKYSTFLPLSDFKKDSEDYLYILPLNTYIFHPVPAELCYEIDKDKLTGIFFSLVSQEGGALYVEDSRGKLQFSLGDQAGDFDRKELRNLNYKDDNANFKYKGDKLNVTRQTSSAFDWTYYFVLPETTISSSLSQLRNMFLFITAAGLCIGFMFLLFISRINERPVLQLNEQLNDTLSRAQQLQSSLDFQQPLVRNTFIRNLMLGRISSKDEMSYIKKYLKLSDDDKTYFVLYLVTYPNEEQLEEYGDTQYTRDLEDTEEFSYANSLSYDTNIIHCLQKYFGEPLYVFNPKKHNYAILLSTGYQDDTEDKEFPAICEKFENLHEDLLNQYAIWTIGGLGNTNHHLENTWKSYQQAYEAVSYASSTNIIQIYSNLDLASDAYYYPSQLSDSLTNFIKAGNKNQVAETFKFIIKENLKKRALSYPKMQSLLTEIYSTLSRIRYSIPEKDKDETIKLVDQKREEYLSFRQLEDIALTLCTFYGKKTSKSQTIDDIKDYIQKNYKDSSMCLTKLSDEFRLSESYLSYLFKESTGENFSMYLEHIRMDAALNLVKESDIPLSDIYQEVGYNNANSFRRVFKKTYGVSAKTMRDSTREGK